MQIIGRGGGAAPIKTINSRQVYAADDVVALPPINVFLLEVDRLNRRCLREDHQPTQVEIPYRSVRACVYLGVLFCLNLYLLLLLFFFIDCILCVNVFLLYLNEE